MSPMFYARPSKSNPGVYNGSGNIPKLFTPLQIGSLKLKNRIAVSPMCMYSSIDGHASDFHLAHLGQFAMHGVGLILMEASAVTPEGRITARDNGIYKDEHIEQLKKITNFVHLFEGKIGIQLAHAGRKGTTFPPFVGKGHGAAVPVGQPDEPSNQFTRDKCFGYEVVAPYALKWNEDLAMPKEMTREDIENLIRNFAEAAVRAEKSGFDVVEIHTAHGYLIHQFLSPISNKRTDEFGGSFENRTRFLRRICQEVKNVWKKPIFVRFSCTDWVEGGWTLEETVKIANELFYEGLCDLADCSSGGLSPDQKFPTLGPGYQVPFASALKKEVKGLLTGAVGGITDPTHVEDILKNEDADLVFMAREFLRNPSWLYSAAKAFNISPGSIERIPQYKRST